MKRLFTVGPHVINMDRLFHVYIGDKDPLVHIMAGTAFLSHRFPDIKTRNEKGTILARKANLYQIGDAHFVKLEAIDSVNQVIKDNKYVVYVVAGVAKLVEFPDPIIAFEKQRKLIEEWMKS